MGIGFNPEAVLRGPRGWPIVARLARQVDVEAVAESVTFECMSALVSEVATEVFGRATKTLEANIEAMLRESYPLVAHLPRRELRQRLREARAQRSPGIVQSSDSDDEGSTVAGRGEKRGVLRRKLGLVSTPSSKVRPLLKFNKCSLCKIYLRPFSYVVWYFVSRPALARAASTNGGAVCSCKGPKGTCAPG